MNDRVDETLQQMTVYIRQGTALLLPMTTIIETGNHIAQNGNGQARRRTAQAFQRAVLEAIEGTAPWTPTPFFEIQSLRQCLGQFPDFAMREIGIGDLTIIEEFHRQCSIHRMRRVFIWSYDNDLAGYDRTP